MDELVSAITTLAREQTGALITFERSQSLIDYINTGTKVNADICNEINCRTYKIQNICPTYS